MLPAVKPQPELCALLHSMSRACHVQGMAFWLGAGNPAQNFLNNLATQVQRQVEYGMCDAHALPVHACRASGNAW